MRLLLSTRTLLIAVLTATTAPSTLGAALAPEAPLALAATHDEPVAVANSAFETAGADGLPSGWSLDGPAPPGATVRRADDGHGGGAAIELGADAPASIAVLSEKMALRIGHVYRLSAWVKTRAAAADPLARYPTAVPATLSMASFPFTNHSPAVGGTRDWTRVETTFVATAATDRVRLDLGRNGTATGRAWFDDVTLAEVGDITEVIPLERVRWEGPAFRYEDRGWIFVHVEGAPYARGRQFGKLGRGRDRRLHPEAVRAARREGPRARLGRAAHPRRRAHAAPLRPRVPRGDEGHRRRGGRGGGRGPRPQGGPRGRRHPELRDRPRLDGGRPSRDAERGHGAELPLGRGRARGSRPPPQVLVADRHGPRDRRRPPRLLPGLHVGRLHRGALQRGPRRRAGEGPPLRDADLPRRDPLRHRLLHERRRDPDRRDDDPPDAVRRRTARRRATGSGRRSSTAPRSTRWRPSCARRTTGCTRTTGPSPT